MINYKIILKVLGSLVILEAVMFVSCLILGFSYGERQWTDFGIPAILATVFGISLLVLGRKAENRMSRRDGFLSVSLSWKSVSTSPTRTNKLINRPLRPDD